MNRKLQKTFFYPSVSTFLRAALATKYFSADGFWLSTAHAAKFCEVIEEAVGVMPELPEVLALAMDKSKAFDKMSAVEKDFAEFLYNL